MPVSDPEITIFSNARARPMADERVRDYNNAKRFKLEWDTRGLTAKIPNDATAIPDGAITDGRKQITGADLFNLYNRCADIITDFEAASSAKLNQLLRISVNDNATF
jgi:hypothetical protein